MVDLDPESQFRHCLAEDRGVPVDALIGLRLGCALAVDALTAAGRNVRQAVFWQPVPAGAQFMTQFLRLRVAASMMEGDSKEGVNELKEKLRAGIPLEVAGYELSPRLWAEIDSKDLLKSLSGNLGQLLIAEVGSTRDGTLSPAGRRLAEAAGRVGIPVDGCRVEGEPFWTTTEIVVNRDLQSVTEEFLIAGTILERRGRSRFRVLWGVSPRDSSPGR